MMGPRRRAGNRGVASCGALRPSLHHPENPFASARDSKPAPRKICLHPLSANLTTFKSYESRARSQPIEMHTVGRVVRIMLRSVPLEGNLFTWEARSMKRSTRSLHSFAPALALLAALGLSVPGAASATPYVVKFVQQGSDVMATGSGEFDLTGLTPDVLYTANGSGVQAADGYVFTGTGVGFLDGYTGFAGPANFGSGGGALANSGTGDNVGLTGGTSFYGYPVFWVPQGYASGTDLANSAIWNGASFASLGMTPGTYTWTWGTAADQSFTLIIGGTTAVPEPTTLGMFGIGMLLIGGFLGLRRRQPPQAR